MAQHKNIDVVFDVYRKSTLKGEARIKEDRAYEGESQVHPRPRQIGEVS